MTAPVSKSAPASPSSGPFACPICRSGLFAEVSVRRPNGTLYRTQFYQCSGCTAMFTDPVKFTEFKPYTLPVKSEGERRREADRLAYFYSRKGDR